MNRRKFLRGAGGSMLALPLLEATANNKNSTVPKRLVSTSVFYGMVPKHFQPTETGAKYKAPRLLKPLNHLRQDFTVFSGLDHNLSGGHEMTPYFLTGIPINHAKGYKEGNISVDQKAALHVGGATRFPSLTLGCESHSTTATSWSRYSAQIRPITSLHTLSGLLFKNDNKAVKQQNSYKIREEKSILDFVRDQAKSFEHGLGKADTEKLDQYFTSVRELEIKLTQSRLWLDKPKAKSNYQIDGGIDRATLVEKAPIFYDLMALALQTDSTRVISLDFHHLGKESGGLNGVGKDIHTLSHHGQEEPTIDELSIIESFFTKQFSRFLGQLKNIKEANGKSLLDNTMALFGSGMSNANAHSNRDLPVILAGGGFKHGEHKHYPRQGNTSVALCNLYLTMLQNFGLEIDSFNTSTGTLSGFGV
jgi:hypothetical protein